MDLGLKDRVVLVTGAGHGIGLAVGSAFVEEGARVAFHYHSDATGASEAARRAQSQGQLSGAYAADVRDRASVDAMVAAVEKDLGPIDILINNAAYALQQNFLESTPEEWEPQLEVTVTGLIHVCQSVLRGMASRGRGSVVTLAGDSGRVGESKLAVTAAGRAAAIGFSKSLAKEMARYGIRVNIVTLGLVKTPAFAHHTQALDQKKLEAVTRMYPLRRLGEMEDVPATVLLLASERAAWTTGQVYAINGGYSMV